MALSGSGAAIAGASTTATTPKTSLTSALKQVNAILAKYSKPTHFVNPGPAVNVKKLHGKTIFFLASTTTLPFVQLLYSGVQAAATAAGLTAELGDSQDQLTEAVRLLDQAIADKVGVIVDFGYTPNELNAPLAAAKAAHIPVVLGFNGDPNVPPPSYKSHWNVVANSTYCYSCAAALVADYAISATKGHVNAMMTYDPTSASSAALQAGFSSELKKWCPKTCTANYVNTPAANAFELTTTAAAAAVQNPATNFIFPQYDGYAAAVIPSITAANAQNRVMVGSDNADLAQMQEMAQGSPMKVDIGSPVAWSGWAVVDQSIRAMLGVAPSPNENLPLRVFDAANVKDFNLAAGESVWYGKINYKLDYEKLWGVAK
jgi:ribose transport system substrate-binding protein